MCRLASILCFATILAACGTSPAAEAGDGGAMDSPDSSTRGAGCTETAEYEVAFVGTWSAETHPDGFPPGPHFSPLIGTT